MAKNLSASIFLPDEAATTALGAALSSVLEPGDTILMTGPVGAAKSHLARAIIKARVGDEEEVPSPTYTLVQTYSDPSGTEIWHADLYRLGDASEVAELGLEDAFSTAICLVEWADRLGEDAQTEDALRIVITEKDNGREMAFSAVYPRWGKVVRVLERMAFLIQTGWHAARAEDVAGDLSSRSYQRLQLGEETAILMDAGEDIASTSRFADMTGWLLSAGYSAPRILEKSIAKGLLLLEDFGDTRLQTSKEHLMLCVELLADVRRQPCPDLPCPDAAELAEMTAMAQHYPGADQARLSAFRHHLKPILENVITGAAATVSLRDFHADNIMWLPQRDGIRRLGLLDYQDAFLTHPVYDLVSLLTDARRDISMVERQEVIDHYAAITGDDLEDLLRAFSVFSAQRNLRILGIFSRAAIRDGKAHHIKNLPRVYGYLSEALEHPVFEDQGKALLAGLPRPDQSLLEHLAA